MHPFQDLTSRHRSGIAAVAVERTPYEAIVDGDVVTSADMGQSKTHVRGMIPACITIRRGHIHLPTNHERATFASQRRLGPDSARHDDRAGDDRACCHLSGVATHEQKAASHAGPGVVTDGAVDDDLAAGHAARRAWQPRAYAVASVSANVNRAAGHADAGVASGVAYNLDRASDHARARVGAGISVHDDARAGSCHARAQTEPKPNVTDDADARRSAPADIEVIA